MCTLRAQSRGEGRASVEIQDPRRIVGKAKGGTDRGIAKVGRRPEGHAHRPYGTLVWLLVPVSTKLSEPNARVARQVDRRLSFRTPTVGVGADETAAVEVGVGRGGTTRRYRQRSGRPRGCWTRSDPRGGRPRGCRFRSRHAGAWPLDGSLRVSRASRKARFRLLGQSVAC